MKILLLGKTGQLGQELSRSLLLLGQVIPIGRNDVNLTDLYALENLLDTIRPKIIVNAAAYTAVDKAEQEQDLAYCLNENVVSVLAKYAKLYNALLIHYSTDYVFDGTKSSAYLETDSVNPLNVYGASKIAGELAILNSGCQGYIFRTSWVFSKNGHNFIKTILDIAQKKETLSIVADQYGAPTSVKLISDVTLLAMNAAKTGILAPGIYHLTSNGITTWYDLAHYIVEQMKNRKIEIITSKIQPVTSDNYPNSAKRPKNSTLNTSKLSEALQITLPAWKIYVDRIIDELR